MIDRWVRLSARVPDALDDEIAAVLGKGSLGVEVAPSGPGTSDVRVYLEPSEDLDSWRERAVGVLQAHGIAASDLRVSVDPVADGRWVERWQASLAPIPLGRRFVVLPTDAAPGHAERDPIRLVPGMAFGTGEHATTRLCATALEHRVKPGTHWLDLGTGTGILAVVAARCGAARVLAVDNLSTAIGVAREVVARNGAAGIVEIREGSVEAAGGERFDGVVANIQASFFLERSGRLAAAMKTDAVLVASGLLDDDLADVTDVFAAEGIRIETHTSDGPWICLVARRLPS